MSSYFNIVAAVSLLLDKHTAGGAVMIASYVIQGCLSIVIIIITFGAFSSNRLAASIAPVALSEERSGVRHVSPRLFCSSLPAVDADGL